MPTQDAYISWDEKNSSEAFTAYGKAINEGNNFLYHRSKAYTNSFKDITSVLSARDPYTRRDYEYFRPDEALPTKIKDILASCNLAYERIGLVHNIIDLMADFACQGIRLTHPNKRIEKFYKNWFKKVKGKDRSERILNMLYRLGNVPIKKSTAKIKIRMVEDLMRTVAEPDLDIDSGAKFEKKEIPWRYTIYNPLSLEIVAPELIGLTNRIKYHLKVDLNLLRTLKRKDNPEIADLLKSVPKDIANDLLRGARTIPLDENKITTLFYKKDDDQPWAKPMLYSILKDLMMLEKLKLTDLSALDGALLKVRVWKLGNLEAKILPTANGVSQLSSILSNNVGGGTIDIVWGPDIELVETATDVQAFLGPEKYEPTLNNIYAGLGIPPTLTGSSTQSGFTNNFISLKTLIERLEYGRMLLQEFWENEIVAVQKAMGFRFAAHIQFDHMTLSDESAEKNLFIQLADRNIISIESVLERFGEVPELEKLRLKRENRDRRSEQLPEKAGPWFNPEKEFDLKKIFAQRGSVTPSEIGLELLPRTPGEITPQEQLIQLKKENTGQPQQGRPKNSRDKQKRDQRTPKIRSSANYLDLFMWANHAREIISEIVTAAWLEMNDKKGVHSLTQVQFNTMEEIKFGVLCNLELFESVNADRVYELLPNAKVSTRAKYWYNKVYSKYIQRIDHKPNINNIREIQSAAYILSKVNHVQS